MRTRRRRPRALATVARRRASPHRPWPSDPAPGSGAPPPHRSGRHPRAGETGGHRAPLAGRRARRARRRRAGAGHRGPVDDSEHSTTWTLARAGFLVRLRDVAHGRKTQILARANLQNLKNPDVERGGVRGCRHRPKLAACMRRRLSFLMLGDMTASWSHGIKASNCASTPGRRRAPSREGCIV